MNPMSTVSLERFVEKLEVDVYPIAIMKFLLNRGKILFYFSKAAEQGFELRGGNSSVTPENCELCKRNDGILCREHTSIDRVMTADKVCFDLDTNTYFYKNEIYRMVGDRLVIVYCPHTKLIKGGATDEKVRKLKPLTIENKDIKIPDYKNIQHFLSTELMNKYMRCWFNNEFSIISIPRDREQSDFCLIPNR